MFLRRILLPAFTSFVVVMAASFILPLDATRAQPPNAEASAPPEQAPPPAPPQGPVDVEAALARAQTLLKLGHLDRAEAELRGVLASSPSHVGTLTTLRRVLIDGRKNAALPDVLAALSAAHAAAGQRDLAEARLDELMALDASHPRRAELDQKLGRGGAQARSDGGLLDRMRGVLGIAAILGIAVLMSNNRKKIQLRLVAWGLGLQIVFALIILWTPPGRWLFDAARVTVAKLLAFTDFGAGFIFGNLYNGVAPAGGQGPLALVDAGSGDLVNIGIIFGFHVLPTIIFFGALMSVLFHLGLIQRVVRGIAWVMTRTLGTSGAESLSAASNIFVGQTEAPLVVKPYVNDMTMSELTAVMTGGFATVAGGVMAAYVRFGVDAGHLLAASVMAAPAGLMLAKIIYPEDGVPRTQGGAVHDPEPTTANVIDAAAAGAGDGMKLAINVAAMLIAFIALIAVVNALLAEAGLSLATIFGYAFLPLSWAMGVDTKDLLAFGNLMGTKLSLNEFVAYVELGHIRNTLSPRTVVIATYALCGFANFSSIGIQIGGISAIAPERRSDLARVGLKAMVAGALATCLTGTIAGILVG
jgi:concentrative nucleoside transporter, CNT family